MCVCVYIYIYMYICLYILNLLGDSFFAMNVSNLQKAAIFLALKCVEVLGFNIFRLKLS